MEKFDRFGGWLVAAILLAVGLVLLLGAESLGIPVAAHQRDARIVTVADLSAGNETKVVIVTLDSDYFAIPIQPTAAFVLIGASAAVARGVLRNKGD